MIVDPPDALDGYSFKTTVGVSKKEYVRDYADKQIANGFEEIAKSTIRPFNLSTFYAIEAGEGAVDQLKKAVVDSFGGGEFAELQELVSSGEFSEEQIDELRENITDRITEMLGPFDALLVDVPGLSWLENKLADMVLGDEVEALRDGVANMEIPLGETILENHCEAP